MTDSLRLYTWNTAISAASYGPLQGLEIALSNAMHRELSWRYGPSWFDNADTALEEHALRNIDRAKMALGRTDRVVEAPQVVAALPFGFWSRSLIPVVNGIQAARRTMRKRFGDRHCIARFRPARALRAGWFTSH